MTEIWQSTPMRTFAEQVRQRADMSSADEASRVARATLTTLAEAVSAGQVDELAEGLPEELRNELSQRSGQARSLNKTEFLDRVSGEIATTDLETTEHQVRAVLTTLRQWAPAGETSDTVAQLPGSIAGLFE
ncbi:DUF2267 domain-containing protein [Actinopolyspora erythraea]|uniref:DUF2267 domain-containing protein n=1 Tax=Actinopolyspora erythraea TaxID=414996 RepID=A0A099D9G0_9ACTN|nr:DUF2267 domain-containing protein [Actinopolyspora erythraea]ASU80510.1 DUF2267 domain-containing protein [Actinopolyspora erythraea]KGI82818.1 hypothetical protein IL38_02810 [Actinopolyspora erythraea]